MIKVTHSIASKSASVIITIADFLGQPTMRGALSPRYANLHYSDLEVNF